MKTGSKGIAIIKEFEGYHTRLPDGSCKAYLDKLVRPALRSKGYPGLWTIGYGCTEGVYEGLVWTEKQAEAALLREVAQTEQEVAQYIKVELNQNQYDAVVSLCYNLTGGLSKAQTLVKHINNQDWNKAADAFLLYTGAGQKRVPGLVRRRNAERALFKTHTVTEIKEKSSTLSTLRRWRNSIAAAFSTFVGADALDIGRSYIDWVKEFSTNYKYLLMAGAVGAGFAVYKYIEHKKVKENEEGRYFPVQPPGVA